jgi:hypothetical protein
MPNPLPNEPDHKTGAVRIIVTDEAARAFARLKAERRIVTLTPATDDRPAKTTTRAVPDREIYELVITSFLERERAGQGATILYPPESAKRRTVWIEASIKAELEKAAKRLDVSVGALFFTATQVLLGAVAADPDGDSHGPARAAHAS